MNVRDAFYEILRTHGITTIFGNPGSNEPPLLQDFPDDVQRPVVFAVARNSEYRALKEFSRFMHAPDAPGMELPGMDIPGIADSYGVQSQRVKSLSDLTHAVKDALTSGGPHLIEISQRRIADSSGVGDQGEPGASCWERIMALRAMITATQTQAQIVVGRRLT